MEGGAGRAHAPPRQAALSRTGPQGREAESKIVDDDPPRAYSDFPFDLDQEIRGAITAAEEARARGQARALYLWSGGAEPFEGAIARTRRLGLRNMNGGDSRFDADYPSISYLSPISRPLGAERQIYAGNANDYLYITDGNGRDHGFLNLEATVNATETPRRLKPINVYYHMFAGERAAQLAGVRHHLDAARQALVTPIGASHYAAIADGFFATANDGARRLELAHPAIAARCRPCASTMRPVSPSTSRAASASSGSARRETRSMSRSTRRRTTCSSRSGPTTATARTYRRRI